jgi:membrane-bound lytic murein transglycosylase B
MRASRRALMDFALCLMGSAALFSGGLAALCSGSSTALGQNDMSFAAFLEALWPEAAHKGITRVTFDAAFAGLTADPNVLAAMQREPEYGKPMGAYLAGLVSPARIGMGQRKSAQWADTLRAVQDKYGVDQAILVSIWGIESSFGAGAQPWDVFRSVATLAQAGFQKPLFHDELLSALKILQDGHIARREFVGSWAGAMGQPQFLPSSYLKYAVDFDGDGKADIWRSVPDVLASIANYMQKSGWQPRLPWGFEVVVPGEFDYRLSRGTFADWTRRGVRRADGSPLPASGNAILFFPSGAAGPAFLVTDNFIALKRFNNSDAYALAVAMLADRLRGSPGVVAAWPADDVQPSRRERIALQHRLAALGYKVADFDGHFDFELRDAVRELQARFGMAPDGHPGRAFLDQVGVAAAR